MKRGGGVHTVPLPKGGWGNRVDGRILSRSRIKETAVAAGREIARKLKVEHTVHRADGVIGDKNSYGNDPCPPKDGR